MLPRGVSNEEFWFLIFIRQTYGKFTSVNKVLILLWKSMLFSMVTARYLLVVSWNTISETAEMSILFYVSLIILNLNKGLINTVSYSESLASNLLLFLCKISAHFITWRVLCIVIYILVNLYNLVWNLIAA